MKKIVFLIGCCLTFMVQASDLLVISGLTVNQVAPTSIEARTLAVQDAQQRAFSQLVAQLVDEKDVPNIIIPDSIQNFVSDYSVKNEKVTSTQYMGELTIRFSSEKVHHFLQEQNVDFLTKLPDPMIVLPIFKINNQVLPFNTSNVLYTSFFNGGIDSPIFTFFVPTLDELYTAGFDAEFVKDSVNINVDELKKKYNTQKVLGVVVDKTGSVYSTKTFLLGDNKAPENKISLTLFDDRDNLSDVFLDVKNNFATAMQAKFKALHQEKAIPIVIYKTMTPVYDLGELSALQKKLKGLTFTEDTQIRAFFNNQLFIDIYYKGTLFELEQKLKLAHLYLSTTPMAGDGDNAIYPLSTSKASNENNTQENALLTQMNVL